MNVEAMTPADVLAHLAQGLQEWQRFDIANGAADFNQHDLSAGSFGDKANAVFDLVGDVWDDLDSAPKIVTTALLGDHIGVNLSGRHIADTVQADINKTFVMSQIKVCLGTSCFVRNAGQLMTALKDVCQCEAGGISEDGLFNLDQVRCIGACGLAPAITVNPPSRGAGGALRDAAV